MKICEVSRVKLTKKTETQNVVFDHFGKIHFEKIDSRRPFFWKTHFFNFSIFNFFQKNVKFLGQLFWHFFDIF